MVVAVRGAVRIQENDGELIRDGVKGLIRQIVEKNSLVEDDIVSVLFSQTKDLTMANPATAMRELGYSQVPLFCMQEPEYAGSMEMVIRALITFNSEEKRPVVPVYLGGAESLRTDIFKS